MTKLMRVFLPVMATAMVIPLAARAASIQAQTLEMDARFNFQYISISVDGGGDFGYALFDLNAGLGYFFNPQWEVLGDVVVQHESIDDFDISSFGLSGRAQYHFATTGNVMPFVAAGLGVLTHGGDLESDEDETEFIFPELMGGVRLPFKDVVSINFFGGYRHRSSPFGFDETSGNEFFMGAGFSIFLRGGALE